MRTRKASPYELVQTRRDKLGLIGKFEKLVYENEELPQSPSVTAPCREPPKLGYARFGEPRRRREPTVEYTSNCSHISNKTATNILFNGKLTLASLRQGGGKIEDFDGGSSPSILKLTNR